MNPSFATQEHALGLVFYGREKTCSALLEEIAHQAKQRCTQVICLATGDFLIPTMDVCLAEHRQALAEQVRFKEETPATHTPIGWLADGDTVDLAFGFCQGTVEAHLLELVAAIPYPMSSHRGARLRLRGLPALHADIVVKELAPRNFIFDENSPLLLPLT